MKNDTTMLLRVPTDLREKFKNYCENHNISMAKYLRKCMEDAIMKEEKE